jgi:hypothetical protein
VRLKPVAIPDALQLDLEERVYKAGFHPETQTLNLVPELCSARTWPNSWSVAARGGQRRQRRPRMTVL